MVSIVSNTRRLRSLLNAAYKDQDLTLDKVVVRTEGRLRRSRVGNLLNEQYRATPLSRDELLLISEGFDVDYDGLRLAHLADMNLLGEDVPDVPAITLELPAGIEHLTPKQKAALRGVIRAMLDPEDDDEGDSATPAQFDAAQDAKLKEGLKSRSASRARRVRRDT